MNQLYYLQRYKKKVIVLKHICCKLKEKIVGGGGVDKKRVVSNILPDCTAPFRISTKTNIFVKKKENISIFFVKLTQKS